MGQTSVDASLDRPRVLFSKEVENLVKVLLLYHGGESPEAEAHVAQQRGPKPPPGETRGASREGGGGDRLILDRGYSLAKPPRFFEGAEKFC